MTAQPIRRRRRFLSTPSARRATQRLSRSCGSSSNFYPRPPRGGRLDTKEAYKQILEFLSTPSARRATGGFGVGCRLQIISIHALREEGDSWSSGIPEALSISIHALREEGDCSQSNSMDCASVFLSTPSARRATLVQALLVGGGVISIHALREEGDSGRERHPSAFADFYPRPPRGGRRRVPGSRTGQNRFLSTPSARRATLRQGSRS